MTVYKNGAWLSEVKTKARFSHAVSYLRHASNHFPDTYQVGLLRSKPESLLFAVGFEGPCTQLRGIYQKIIVAIPTQAFKHGL